MAVEKIKTFEKMDINNGNFKKCSEKVTEIGNQSKHVGEIIWKLEIVKERFWKRNGKWKPKLVSILNK